MERALMRDCVCGAGVVAMLAGAAGAQSVDLNFVRVTNNNVEDVSGQLGLTVASVGGDPGAVDFTFSNDTGIRSSISEIYFDNGDPASHLASGSLFDQDGASFTFGSGAPPNLPGGNTLMPPFQTTPGFLADAQGNPRNGLDASGDFLTLRFDLLDGVGFDELVDAIQAGELRVGMHLRAIGAADGSDSYVSSGVATVIPLPTTAGLASLGALGLAMRRRR